MTLARRWVGKKEKPPVFFDPGSIDPKWSWVYDSLVAVWLFNEPGGDTLRDVYGRANGTLVAGTGSKPTWNRDGALWGLTPIDAGATSGIDIGGDALGDNFTPEQLSVETWSKWPADDDTDPRLFSKQSSGASADHFIMTGAVNSDQVYTHPRMRLRTGSTTTTFVLNDHLNKTPLEGDLVHMLWTYDGVNVRCYLNAVDTALGSSTKTGTVAGGSGVPIRIGNSAYAGATNEWDAPIYKVAIYRTALNMSQIYQVLRYPYGAFRPGPSPIGFGGVAGGMSNPIA